MFDFSPCWQPLLRHPRASVGRGCRPAGSHTARRSGKPEMVGAVPATVIRTPPGARSGRGDRLENRPEGPRGGNSPQNGIYPGWENGWLKFPVGVLKIAPTEMIMKFIFKKDLRSIRSPTDVRQESRNVNRRRQQIRPPLERRSSPRESGGTRERYVVKGLRKFAGDWFLMARAAESALPGVVCSGSPPRSRA